MNTHRNLKHLLSILLCAVLTTTLPAAALAAPAPKAPEPSGFVISVPSRLPIFVNTDHSVYVATGAELKNIGNIPMEAEDLTVKPASGWELAAYFDQLPEDRDMYGWLIQNAVVNPHNGKCSVDNIGYILADRHVALAYDTHVSEHDEPILTYANTVFTVREYEPNTVTEPSVEPDQPPETEQIPKPEKTPEPEQTPKPEQNPKPSVNPKPTPTPHRNPVSVKGVSLDKDSLVFKTIGETFVLKATVTPANADNKTLIWASENEAVATVDQSGKVTAVRNGETYVTVTTKDGSFSARCKVVVDTTVKVTGVSLDKNKLSFDGYGETKKLIATITPENATNKEVTWTSSNTKVARVDQNGKVTAVSEGKCTITVTTADGNFAADCEVKVSYYYSGPVIDLTVYVSGIRLDQNRLNFSAAGDTETLTATVTPSNATNKGVIWTSSNTGVATVNQNGKVTAIADGTAVITAKTVDGGYTARCDVTVDIPAAPTIVHPTSISINESDFTMTSEGETKQLTAVVLPADTTNKSVIWSSSNEGVATVNENGVVTAVSDGTAVITVTTVDGNKTDSVNVTVDIAPVVVHPTSLSINENDFTMTEAGETKQLSATVLPQDATNKSVVWSSDDESVATVSATGVVTAVSNGTAVITATSADNSSLSDSVTATVDLVNHVNSVSINEEDFTLTDPEETRQLTVTIDPDDATNPNVTWESSDESVATVDDNGVVTAVGNGECTITVTTEDGSFTDTCIVTVNAPVPVTGVTLDKNSLSFTEKGAEETLTATVNPSNATNKAVGWSSSNTSVATVDQNGKVTAVGNGECTITAKTKDGNFAANCTVTVSYTILAESVTFTEHDVTVTEGNEITLTVEVVPANTGRTVTFVLPAESVGHLTIKDVKTNGDGTTNVTVSVAEDAAELPGVYDIIATTDGKSDTCKVTVMDAVVFAKADMFSAVSGFSWQEALDNGYVSVTDGKLYGGANKSLVEKVTVPADAGVTSVGENAFKRCFSLQEMNLPETVVEIGNFAFMSCIDLKQADIPASVTTIGQSAFFGTKIGSATLSNVESIGEEAFYGCDELASVTICESGLTAIPRNGFAFCDKLSSVSLPNGIETIKSYAFRNCPALESISIPDTVTALEDGAFAYDTALTSLVIPTGVTKIAPYLVSGCTALESIELPDGLQSIGIMAFVDCTALESIRIPASCTSLYSNSFSGCSGMVSMEVEAGNTKYDSRNDCNAIIETAGNTLVRGCNTTVIPDDVVKIDFSAFESCLMTEIHIPASVKTISDRAFTCPLLDDIYVDQVKEECPFAETAPWGAADTVTVHWKTDPTVIQEDPIEYTNFVVSATNKAAVGYTGAQNENLVIPATFVGDGNNGTTEGENYKVTSIGDEAFRECTNLKSVTIPDGVTYIGTRAFWDCFGLTSVNIPEGVTRIGFDAFGKCQLTSITIPKSVTTIDYYAFEYTEVSSVAIPEDVASIGQAVFMGCKNLISIVVDENNPVYDSRNNCNAIIETATNTLIAGCKNTVIPDGVTSIGNRAFGGCYSLTNVTIPDGVTSIGDLAFYNCYNLESVEIPDSVETIGNSAFMYCYKLTSIAIPNSVTSIGDQAFYYCNRLTSINYDGTMAQWDSITKGGNWDYNTSAYTIHCTDGCMNKTGAVITCPIHDEPAEEVYTDFEVTKGNRAAVGYAGSENENLVIPATFVGDGNNGTTEGENYKVTSIGNQAFQNCSSLTSITIPDGVTRIGNSAFYDCSGLTSITIPDSVTSIGCSAFLGCSSLTSITIPDSVTSIGKQAFSNCSSLTSIIVSDGNEKYDSRNNCNAIIETATNTLIAGCKNTIIPNNVTSIGDRAFEGCESLTSINIPDGVTSIGVGAFYNCRLTNVTIPDSVTSIGGVAFCSCRLTNVTIPDSVTSIGGGAFSYCTSLTSITIPNSVTSIGSQAFDWCTSLTSINYDGTTEQWAAIEKGTSWDSNTGAYTIHCTDGDI